MLDLLILLIIAGFFIFKNFKKLNNNNKNPWNSGNNQNNIFNSGSFKEKFNNFMNFSQNNNNANNNNNSQSYIQNNSKVFNFMKEFGPLKIISLGIVIILILWFFSGIYIIQPDEEGVETLLGKYSKTTNPGLHFRIPSPITKIYKVKVTTINTEEIGYRGSGVDDALMLIESTMVTKDENIIDVSFDVQWRVSDAAKFVFNIKSSDISSTIRFASESVMRDLIGRNNMSFALGEGRAILAEQVRAALQKILDEYQLGISILSIPIKKIDPPKQVIAAFRDVQSARADKEREINMALAYKNDILPRARGKSAKIINESEAYYYSIVNKANGEIAKMQSLYPLYKQNKELVKTKLYTELLNDVFSNMNKIILPPNSTNSQGSGQINFLNIGDIFNQINKNKSPINENSAFENRSNSQQQIGQNQIGNEKEN